MPNNPEDVIKEIHTAAEKGDVEAQFQLGSCYTEGNGVIQDHKQAMQWWRNGVTTVVRRWCNGGATAMQR